MARSRRLERTEGHTETTISGDTRADWSEAFELVPSLQVRLARDVVTHEVLNGLLRIGFTYPQQIIWNKGRTVLTRTHYWISTSLAGTCASPKRPGTARLARIRQCGIAHRRSSLWAVATQKFDYPTQKPVELMRRPILNHKKRGELV
jgi:hypothetical protein